MMRPRDGRVIAGVALAVSERLGLSAGAVRLIWFISAFFGGLGVLLYIAGWLLIPEEDQEQSIAEEVTGRVGDLSTWIGIGLIAVAAVSIISAVGWVRSDLVWAVALLAVGVLLYRGNLGTWSGGPVGPSGDGDEEGTARSLVEAEPAAGTDAGVDQTATDAPAEARRAVRPRRERSILGRLTVGTVFIVLGTMLVLDTSDVIRPSFNHYVAVAVAVIGLGLVVGSVVGRSRGLIVLGILLLPLLLASTVVTAAFDGGWGDPVYRPVTLDEIDARYNLSGGDLELDLRRVDLSGSEVSIEADVGFGRLLVLIPDGAGYDITAHVGFGDIDFEGSHEGGIDVDQRFIRDGVGTFELDLDVGFGQIEIREVGR
jgi:phage shock protein PspC (stress-responsive transcriptional regulator)